MKKTCDKLLGQSVEKSGTIFKLFPRLSFWLLQSIVVSNLEVL